MEVKKTLSWLPTVLFLFTFGAILLIFHVLQMLAFRIFGYAAHKTTVDVMMWCMNKALILVGAPLTVRNLAGELPTDRPLIIVSNHQGMFDIPAMGVALRQHHPKYISKIELAKGIPSISYNLRHGGSVLIDRKDGRGAIKRINDFCDYLKAHNRAGVIFPEGTRTRDGKMLPFRTMGLKVMLKAMPDAVVVPIALENFWHLEKYRLRPIPFGYPLKCTILPPIDRTDRTNEEVMTLVEQEIRRVADRKIS